MLEYEPRRGVVGAGGDVLRACIQCGTCSAVCPMGDYAEQLPRRLIAMLRAELDDEVLRGRSIWVCTSCYACTVECPKQIPLTDAISALKRASMRAGAYPARFPTPIMAREFVRAVERWGRSTESWISLGFHLKTDPVRALGYAPLALRLMRRGRMSFRRERVAEPAAIRRLFEALDAAAGGPA